MEQKMKVTPKVLKVLPKSGSKPKEALRLELLAQENTAKMMSKEKESLQETHKENTKKFEIYEDKLYEADLDNDLFEETALNAVLAEIESALANPNLTEAERDKLWADFAEKQTATKVQADPSAKKGLASDEELKLSEIKVLNSVIMQEELYGHKLTYDEVMKLYGEKNADEWVAKKGCRPRQIPSAKRKATLG